MRSFRIACSMAIGSVALGVASLLLYPGGTFLDRSARGYSFFHNFLSDAGLTVAFNGQPNSAGSAFALGSSALAAIAITFCATGLIHVYSSSRRRRRMSLGAAALLLLSCVGWVGAALSPANRSAVLHMYFAHVALGSSAAASLLFALATARDTRFPKAVPLAWLAVAALIPGLVSQKWWGPAVTTDSALMFYAITQKFVIFSSVAILIYESHAASVVARSARSCEEV